MLSLLLLVALADPVPTAPAPLTSDDPAALDDKNASDNLAASALGGAGAAVGGALGPVILMGTTLVGVQALQGVASFVPPPRDFYQGESYGVCVVTPLVIVLVGGAEVCGAALGLGATFGLAWLGAWPAGPKAQLEAGTRAVGGSCAGCALGFLGLCGYSILTSTTANGVTTFGNFPQAETFVMLMAASSLGAAAATSVPLAVMAY